jgi:hypothetical protein
MKAFLFLILFLSLPTAFAIDFEKVAIPGAKCGDGSPYHIFFSKGRPDKLLIEFMGGGVCWDKKSCTSCFPKAEIGPIPNINRFSVFTVDKPYNPFREHTIIYFPYCTGDVHVGDIVENYDGKNVFHVGRLNVQLAIKFLEDKKMTQFNQFTDLTVWGSSAGAIGSLYHGKILEQLVSPGAKKTMIVDSPGLHFGKNFWHKFSPQFFESFERAGAVVDLKIYRDDGFIAKDFGPVFEKYKNWQMGFLFATHDIVMSKRFGEISPKQQATMLRSSQGLPAIAAPYSNVKIWIKNSYWHTFFIFKTTSKFKSEQGQSAIDFAKEVYAQNNLY